MYRRFGAALACALALCFLLALGLPGVAAAVPEPGTIVLSPANVAENSALNTEIGALSVTGSEGIPFSFSLEGAESAAFSVVGDKLISTGMLDYESHASYTFTVNADDGEGGVFSGLVTVTVDNVNEAPVCADDEYTILEDRGPFWFNVFANDYDPDGDPLPGMSSLGWTGLDHNIWPTSWATGQMIYWPPSDFNGLFSAYYTTWGGGYATIRFTVQPVNDAPRDITLDTAHIAENSPSGTIVGSLSATDIDSSNFTFALAGDDASAFSVVGDELHVAGMLDYETKSSYTFTVRCTDDSGAEYAEEITIDIEPVAEAPTGVTLGASTIAEGAPLGDVVGAVSVDDVDSTEFTHELSGPDAGLFQVQPDGNLCTAADIDYELTGPSLDITITSTDESNLSVSQSFKITVEDIASLPQHDDYSMDSETVLTVDAASGVLANDGGDLTPAVVAEASDPAKGTLALQQDGAFVYTPDSDFAGTDEFTYRVVNGANVSEDTTVSITVDWVDRIAPVTTDDAVANYLGEAMIKLQAADEYSGVAGTRFWLDGVTDATEGATVQAVTTGAHALKYQSWDNAGNFEETKTVAFSVASDIKPVSAENRYKTAVNASNEAFADGSSTEVVIARGDGWADAMTAASLAGALDAPLLLTPHTYLDKSVVTEMDRLGVTHAYLVGGEAALTPDVANGLAMTLGGPEHVDRIGGANRYDTARLVAMETVGLLGEDFTGDVFVATGSDWPDAVSASALSAGFGRPVLLSANDELSAVTLEAMRGINAQRAILLGGTRALSATVADDAATELGAQNVQRLWGSNRYQTALAVAGYGLDHGLSMNGVAIGSGQDYPDVLAGGVMQGRFNSVVLVTMSDSLYPGVRDVLAANKAQVGFVRILGGPNAVTEPVRVEIADALK